MFRFDSKKVDFSTKLGKGGYGTVYPYVDPKNPTDNRWAVKRISAPDFETVLAHINEIVLGFSCDHPALLPIKGYHIKRTDPNYENFQIYIKMPRMEADLKSELEKHSTAKKHIPEEKIIQYLHTLAAGLEYLHKRKIAHRDIKPGNILIDKQGQLKLGDIGIGKLLPEDEVTYSISHAGTPAYTPPELVENNPQLKKKDLYKADIWSLGITIAELCLLHPKLGEATPISQLEAAIHEKLRSLQGKYSIELLELIMGLLQSDPSHRLSAAQVKEILEVEPWGIDKYEFQNEITAARFRNNTHGNTSVNTGLFDDRKGDETRSSTVSLGPVTDWKTGIALNVNEFEKTIEIIGKPRWVEENLVKNMLNDLTGELKKKSMSIINRLEANFSGCYSVTDYSVKNLVKINESDFQGLQHILLNFDYCFRVTDNALAEVASKVLIPQNNLRSLDLSFSYCTQISDQGIGALLDQISSTSFGNLWSLRLAFRACNNITDETIRKISMLMAKQLRNLTKLDLDFKDCKQINFQEVDELVVQTTLHLRQLQEINLIFSPFGQVPLKEKTDLQKQLKHIPHKKVEV